MVFKLGWPLELCSELREGYAQLFEEFRAEYDRLRGEPFQKELLIGMSARHAGVIGSGVAQLENCIASPRRCSIAP